MRTGNTIIHVEFTSGPRTGEHFYFGGISAIFDTLTPQEIGVKKKRLWDFNIESGKPYSNKICTIRKSVLHRKQSNRIAPIKVIRVT